MFRDEEDHGMFINLMALRSFAEQADILVDAEMSTHAHLNVFANWPVRFASNLRMSYTRYFNKKYSRKGRLGQKNTFLLKVVGNVHQMILENYILRNGLHHNAASTAFGYEFCSVRDLFAEDICLLKEQPCKWSRADIASYLPRHAEFPDQYQMNEKGFFVRRSFMEIRLAERYYGSPRNYLYQMNRLTNDDWIQEQQKDQSGPAITLQDIENADEKSIAEMLKNENGKNFVRTRLQDLDVCRLIDQDILQNAKTVYQLSDTEKKRIGQQLKYDYHLADSQIHRCLVL